MKDLDRDKPRAVGRSENLGVCGGHNLPLLVEIGLTDLPKWGVQAPPAPQLATALQTLDTRQTIKC